MNPPARASGRQTWCGPYALALLAGVTYAEAYEVCCRVCRKPSVKGMTLVEAERAGRRLGLSINFMKTDPVTLRAFADLIKPRRRYMVNVTRHFVVVDSETWSVCDNQTAKWAPIATSKHARKRCVWAAEVKPIRRRAA